MSTDSIWLGHDPLPYVVTVSIGSGPWVTTWADQFKRSRTSGAGRLLLVVAESRGEAPTVALSAVQLARATADAVMATRQYVLRMIVRPSLTRFVAPYDAMGMRSVAFQAVPNAVAIEGMGFVESDEVGGEFC